MPPEPPRKGSAGFTRQFAVVMELPFVIVGSVLTGGFFGFLLDRWLHTQPWLMIVLGGMGFYAGLRETLRRIDAASKKKDKGSNGDVRDPEP